MLIDEERQNIRSPGEYKNESVTDGYPKSGPNPGRDRQTITIGDHFKISTDDRGRNLEGFMINPPRTLHNTRDWNDPDNTGKSYPVQYNDQPVFSAATTDINPLKDPDKQKIIDNGLESYERDRMDMNPPLSPMHPFTRLYDPREARRLNIVAYNRTKIPLADIEHRKAFRHIFISRPECYIMAKGNKLSQQAENDEDFSSSYMRMPHISKLLSPYYIGGTVTAGAQSNWNFLLSNRALGLSVANTTLSLQENISKSIEGYTVTPGMHLESSQGAEISISFRDTKYVEIYELSRLWMMYIWKLRKGIFAPSFNGYEYSNNYRAPGSVGSGDNLVHNLHPYDRALDYCASLYDIVVDETGSKILYWCKYYGIYPKDVSNSLSSSDNGGALTNELKTDIVFKYHYKQENNIKNLIEFNYNSGITNHVGKTGRSASKLQVSDAFMKTSETSDFEHIGASGMFTGIPFITLARSGRGDPLNYCNSIYSPFLNFAPLTSLVGAEVLDAGANLGFTSIHGTDEVVLGTL